MVELEPDYYPMRAQVEGVLSWTCPHCSHVNRHKLTAGHWLVNCLYEHCKRSYVLGLTYYRPHPGYKARRPGDPPDGLITEPIDYTVTPTPALETTREPIPIASPSGYRKPFTNVHKPIDR